MLMLVLVTAVNARNEDDGFGHHRFRKKLTSTFQQSHAATG